MSIFETMQDLCKRWEPHREGLLEAVAHTNGTHTEDDVLAMILGGSLFLTTSESSACVWEIQKYPRFNVLNAFLATGELKDMDYQMTLLEAKAKELGCKRVTFGGLPKWRCVAKGEGEGLAGFKLGGVYLYKDVA